MKRRYCSKLPEQKRASPWGKRSAKGDFIFSLFRPDFWHSFFQKWMPGRVVRESGGPAPEALPGMVLKTCFNSQILLNRPYINTVGKFTPVSSSFSILYIEKKYNISSDYVIHDFLKTMYNIIKKSCTFLS